MSNWKTYFPFYRRNLELAVPVMITQAGQMVVQLADNIMVGRLGTAQFAGVSLANSVFVIGMVFCIGFTQGLIPPAGRSYGQGRHRAVAGYFKNALLLDMLACGLVTAALFGILPLLPFMGQDSDILQYTAAYYRINALSLIPFILFFAIRNFSEGIGITKYAMYITVSSNLLNILLNWMLIFGKGGFPALGVRGAALSTLICRVLMLLSFAILIRSIHPYRRYLRFIRRPWIERDKIRELLQTSIPIALQGLVEVTAFSLSSIMVGWFGKAALAANQIAMTASTFSFMIAQGFGVAATIRVSHQFGEKNYPAARKAGFAAVHLSVAGMSLAGICYVLLRSRIPLIFSVDPEVIALAAKLLIISAGFQIFDATQLAGLASLRALSDVKIPLAFSLIAYYLVCLPLGFICGKGLGLGPQGIWIGLMLGLLFAAALFLYRFDLITRRLLKP